jgi:O-6-methylguanine DNA methyltransferase
MSTTATLITLHHPLFGEATGALDDTGRWLVLVPGKKSRAEVEERCKSAGFEIVEGDAAARTGAQATFDYWYATGAAPAVAPIGTDFQKSVWAALITIPRGTTRTYGEIAKQINCDGPRAVGRAIGANKVGFFVPCHRVVATYGAGGFAWGPVMKEKLLTNEGVKLAEMFPEPDPEVAETPGRPRRHFPKPKPKVAPAKKPRK